MNPHTERKIIAGGYLPEPATATERTPDVWARINQLQAVIEEVEKKVAILSERLAPVLSHPIPQPLENKKDPDGARTALGESIILHVRHLSEIYLRLGDLINRLEV